MKKEEPNLLLNDDSTIIFLNTTSPLDDVSNDLKGFLKYVECSTDNVVKAYDSPLVRTVAKRVAKVKENKEIRREYMTLERYIEEREEDVRLKNARALLDILDDEIIAERIGLPLEQVKELRMENSQKANDIKVKK